MEQQSQLCNIDQYDINRRRRMGLLGGIVAIVSSSIYIFTGLILVLSIAQLAWFVAAIGLLQAKMKFCVYNGMNGVDNSMSTHTPVSTAVRKTFWLQSIKITIYAGIISFAISVVLVLVNQVI